MPAPRLELPESEHTAVFRALVKALRADATLHRVVKTWRDWSGSPDDSRPITSANLPIVWLTPEPHAARPVSTDTHYMPLQVRVETGVFGTNADDSMNLWRAVYRAIFVPAALARLEAAGCVTGNIELIQPPFGIRHQTNRLPVTAKDIESSGITQILVAGLIIFPIYVPT